MSLGGPQLNTSGPICGHHSTLVATQVFKCGCQKGRKRATHFVSEELAGWIGRPHTPGRLWIPHSPNCARITGVLYTLMSHYTPPRLKLKPSTLVDMHHLLETLNPFPEAWSPLCLGIQMSDLGVNILQNCSLRCGVHSAQVLNEQPRGLRHFEICILIINMLTCDGV